MPPRHELKTLALDATSTEQQLEKERIERAEKLEQMRSLLSKTAGDDSQLMQQINRLREELERVKLQLKDSIGENEKLKLLTLKLKAGLSQTKTLSTSKDQDLERLRTELEASQASFEASQQQIIQLREAISQLEQREAELVSANKQLSEANTELEDANRQLEHDLKLKQEESKRQSALLEEFENVTVPRLELEIREKEDLIKVKTSEGKRISQEITVLRQELTETSGRFAASSEKNEENTKIISQLKARISEKEQHIAGLDKIIEENKLSIDSLKRDILQQRAQYESEISRVKAEILEIQQRHLKEIAEMKAQHEIASRDLSQRLGDAQDETAAKQREVDSKQQLIERKQARISSLEQEVASSRDGYTRVLQEKEAVEESLAQEKLARAEVLQQKASVDEALVEARQQHQAFAEDSSLKIKRYEDAIPRMMGVVRSLKEDKMAIESFQRGLSTDFGQGISGVREEVSVIKKAYDEEVEYSSALKDHAASIKEDYQISLKRNTALSQELNDLTSFNLALAEKVAELQASMEAMRSAFLEDGATVARTPRRNAADIAAATPRRAMGMDTSSSVPFNLSFDELDVAAGVSGDQVDVDALLAGLDDEQEHMEESLHRQVPREETRHTPTPPPTGAPSSRVRRSTMLSQHEGPARLDGGSPRGGSEHGSA